MSTENPDVSETNGTQDSLFKAIDSLKDIGNKIKQNPNRIFNVDHIKNFVVNTVRIIAFVSIYFYFGASFLILTKNAETYPNGLPGQDPNKPPYKGDFKECLTDIDISKSFMDWTFPYKNSVLCNREANINRPLYFRGVSYLVDVLAKSYSYGRRALNTLLFTANDSIIALGPLIFVIMLLVQPLFSHVVTFFTALINYEKILPHCYMQFWFPITTFLIYLWGVFIYPIIVTITQTLHLIGYILYPSFGKINIVDGEGENRTIKQSHGIFSVLKTMFSNSVYVFVTSVIIIYNLYSYLDFRLALPFILFISYTLFYKLKIGQLFN